MTLDDAYFARLEDAGTRRQAGRRPRRAGTDRKARHVPRTREDWIRAARQALIRGGIGAVRIVPLARTLKMSRGGFYWHFTGRQDLLDALLDDWVRNNTTAFEAVLNEPGRNGRAAFRKLVDVWVAEQDYSPAWDTALRNWARLSRKVAAAVKRVDQRRIEIIHRIFLDLGYRDPAALVRARIVYFHQVGYYTLGLEDTRQRRLELLPVYIDSLIGPDPH